MSEKSLNNEDLNKQDLQAKNKLLLLYLINKIDIPLSNSQISEFALSEEYMNYFSLQQYLSEMVSVKYLEISKNNNTTRYTITEEGSKSLAYFEKYIPHQIKTRINEYILENKKNIKKDYETTANYFKDINNNDFIVKCGVYEDENILMEINLTVVTREYAKLICENWKNNINNLYGNILSSLISEDYKKKEDI